MFAFIICFLIGDLFLQVINQSFVNLSISYSIHFHYTCAYNPSLISISLFVLAFHAHSMLQLML